MKKLIFAIITFLVILAGIYIIWWNLPLTVIRSTDVKLGEEIINKIENHKKTNGLPDNQDWETLRSFGFRDKIDFLQPEYNRIDSETFELIYIEGFDGPYLMWNSKERIWKEGYPTFQQKKENEKKIGI